MKPNLQNDAMLTFLFCRNHVDTAATNRRIKSSVKCRPLAAGAAICKGRCDGRTRLLATFRASRSPVNRLATAAALALRR